MRHFFLISIFAFAFGSALFAQPAPTPQLVLKSANRETAKQDLFTPFYLGIKKDSATLVPLQNRLPLNYYSTHLGAACKMELQLEKQIKLPLRIRLGSKEQVDYLEGKFSRNK